MAQNGGKVVSLTHRPPLPPGNTPSTHFCYRLSQPQGHSAIGRIMSMKNSNDTSWNQWRTQDFFGGGGSTNSVEDRGQRERGSGGGSPLFRVSGGSCNLVQQISFHVVKFS